ncbi:MAG: hypothetical protein JWR09_492, partial [Mucilaginibacter sp.]|nr:hypothetical protein [Mucilaginibacter sp.]
MFTLPTIVTSDDLNKRSYVTFYFNNIRVREYNAKSIGLPINPNRTMSIIERNNLLEELRFELRKALEAGKYPKSDVSPEVKISSSAKPTAEALTDILLPAQKALFNAVRAKIKSSLSKKY